MLQKDHRALVLCLTSTKYDHLHDNQYLWGYIFEAKQQEMKSPIAGHLLYPQMDNAKINKQTKQL
jgi:hypothetical protein